MSTENISEEATAARAALGVLSDRSHKRLSDVRKARRGKQEERDKIVVGARAAMQAVDDEDALLEEEEGQLEGAVHGSPDDSPPPSASSVSVERQPDVASEVPLPPARPEPSASDVSVDHAASEVPSHPQNAPSETAGNAGSGPTHRVVHTDQVPVVPGPTVVVRERGFHPLHLPTWWAWIFAIIAAIIGFGISRASNHWITHTVFHCPNGAGYYIVATLWCLILIGLGFFLGGLLGWYIDRDIRRSNASDTE